MGRQERMRHRPQTGAQSFERPVAGLANVRHGADIFVITEIQTVNLSPVANASTYDVAQALDGCEQHCRIA